jgi:aspartyl-tRNA(Asn)/glutamyl-tRNA(Gln) amidotransferase subunit A
MQDAVAVAGEVAAGERTAAEVVAAALTAARERAGLGAFWSLSTERALARAAELDARIAASTPRLPLAGVPLAVKDNFDMAGQPTTGGLRGERPPADADAAAVRLLERAGAVAIGKTAMDPLAFSTHGQADGFPPCVNPIDPRLSPGGSSAGSAVAVAAGIALLGLGTDTAGSLRIPAAFCGLVALKPSSGDVAADGCLPLARTFDTIGVLGTSVRACAQAHGVLARRPLPGGALGAESTVPAPVGVLVDLFEAADPSVATACERVLQGLKTSGMPLEDLRLDWWAPGFGLLLAAEFAEAWATSAAQEPERFPRRILSAIERARAIDRDRHDEVRAELMAARSGLSLRLDRFAGLLSPTVPVPVPAVEQEEVETSTRFTRIFNALDWPALSVPCGVDDRGRPVAMQVASARDLSLAVRVAASVERCALRI